jgi:AraC-like DNA-binding protein
MSQRTSFSSDQLFTHLSDEAKAAAWYEIMNSGGYSIDYVADRDRPFWCGLSTMDIGRVNLARSAGTTAYAERTKRHVAIDGREGFRLFLNQSSSVMNWRHPTTEFDLRNGEAFLTAASEPGRLTVVPGSYVDFITVPAEAFAALHADFGSALQRRLVIDNEALKLLRRYWQLLASQDPLASPALIAHAEGTLLDLLALATGAKGDAAAEASLRGLRAARLTAILANLRAGFANPHLSTRTVARDLNLSVRYVNDLLAETGRSFAEHVLELRLQRVRQTLTDRAHDTRRISDIAYAAGFSDISYFNRCFRRRFGCTPGALR